ncbi:MAG: hypothetical protein CMF45_08320 [Legionellales bacterium]|nr:hypothetical protein [Legionellales bacterium]
MKEDLIATKPTQNTSKDLKSFVIYDYLCIGTSIIMCLEACYRASKGESVLMVDRGKTLGGAWTNIEIDGIKNIENAIHYFLPDDQAIKFMRDKLHWPIEVSRRKYRYFKFFRLGYLRSPYSSWLGRLIQKVFYFERQAKKLNVFSHIFKSIAEVVKGRGERSYYVKNGSKGMLNSIKSMVKKMQIDIWYESDLTNVVFDDVNKHVQCKVNDKTVLAKTLVLGHGARLPVLENINGNLELTEKIYPRPAFHLIVEDSKKIVDLEIIMTSDSLIKYVHDVSRFTSLNDEEKLNIKVFVFALHSHVNEDESLADKLLSRLVDIGLVNADSRILSSLYSDVILPTLHDEDLYMIKDRFGDLVSVLRTENFSKGIGYYAEKWSN